MAKTRREIVIAQPASPGPRDILLLKTAKGRPSPTSPTSNVTTFFHICFLSTH